MRSRHILHTAVRETPAKEVRHLLLDVGDGPSATLIMLSGERRTQIASGNEKEMTQQAEATVREWINKEGFKLPDQGIPIYEQLAHTIALASLIGYTVIYDSKYKSSENFTGAIRLNEWKGITNEGQGYEYALDSGTILARATLPPAGRKVTFVLG